MRKVASRTIIVFISPLLLFLLAIQVYSGEPMAVSQGFSLHSKVVVEIVKKTNEVRSEVGVQLVHEKAYLSKAAAMHSQEMQKLNYFSHTSPTSGREKPRDRVQLSGGDDPKIGENIYRASGLDSEELASRAMAAWEKSPSHYKNLVDPDFNAIGVGISVEGDEFVVTQVFSQQRHPRR